jgi:hypothetical protein
MRVCVCSHTHKILRERTWFFFIRRVRKFAKSDYHFCPSYRLSIWNTTDPAGRISRNFIFKNFCENLSRKFKFYWNMTRIAGIWHEHQCTFTIISWWMIRRMRSVLDKIFRGNRNIHFMFNNIFFPGNRSVDEIMWEKYGTARQDNKRRPRQDAISTPDK